MIYLFIGTVIGIAICAAFCAITSMLSATEKDQIRRIHDFYAEASPPKTAADNCDEHT